MSNDSGLRQGTGEAQLAATHTEAADILVSEDIRCIAIGERLGRFDKRPIPMGCYSSYAPDWIAPALKKKI